MISDPRGDVVWHPETITSRMEDALRALRKISVFSEAYLAGGTGLALRLGHRLSVDFDFFQSDPFDEEILLQRVQLLPGVAVVQRAPQTLHLIVQEVKVSLLNYMYPLLFTPAEFMNVLVADPRDIACMKITAIASHGSKRDFVDLYAASEHFGLSELMKFFSRKYAPSRVQQASRPKIAYVLRGCGEGSYAAHARSTGVEPSEAILRTGSAATRIGLRGWLKTRQRRARRRQRTA